MLINVGKILTHPPTRRILWFTMIHYISHISASSQIMENNMIFSSVGPKYGSTVPYKSISSGDILFHRPYIYMGLVYGISNQLVADRTRALGLLIPRRPTVPSLEVSAYKNNDLKKMPTMADYSYTIIAIYDSNVAMYSIMYRIFFSSPAWIAYFCSLFFFQAWCLNGNAQQGRAARPRLPGVLFLLSLCHPGRAWQIYGAWACTSNH